MKIEEARQKICPFMSDDTLRNCICESCMLWITTVNGKKEVARTKIPYDTYPMEEGRIRRQLEKDGYEEHRLDGETRDTFIKYEVVNEGYCLKVRQ